MSFTGAPLRGPLPGPLVRPRRPAVLDAAKTAQIPLRPLTIGEILDGAFLVVRINARKMIGLPLVIAGGTAAYVLLGVGLWFLLGNTTGQGVQIVLVVLMALLGMFLVVQCLVWMTAILSRVSLQTVLGDGFAPITSQVSLRSSLPLFLPMLGLALLQYVASSIIQSVVGVFYYAALFAGLLAGEDFAVLASVVVSVLAFLLTAVAYGYIALTVPALAVESKHTPGWIGKPFKQTNVLTSFERSVKLVGLKNVGRVTLIMAGAMIVCLALISLLSVGFLAVVALYASALGVGVVAVLQNPWTIFGVVAFSVVVALSALLAFMSAVQTLVYLDLRMRREALDLALRFDCVPIPQPSLPPMVFRPPPMPPPGQHR